MIGGRFCPPRNIWQCLENILVVTDWEGREEGVATDIKRVEWVDARDAAKHLKMHRTTPSSTRPHPKELSDSNDSGAVENPGWF